jgi:hypothetical protein
MGLDIAAYRGLTRAAEGEGLHPEYAEEADYEHGWFRLYKNDEFPGRAGEIDDEGIYRATEEFGFRAGSYSGYNEWRDQLAALVGHPSEKHVVAASEHLMLGDRWSHAASVWNNPAPGPFMELINFSDCEGTIGTTVSAKLAKDFADWQEKADAHEDEWFREKYADWRKAFEMAADNGCVVFH